MRARISSLTPSLPESPLLTDTMLMPSFWAISAMRTLFAMVHLFPRRSGAVPPGGRTFMLNFNSKYNVPKLARQ